MPDASPARLKPDHALDEMLAALFRRLQSEPAPARLIALVDELEASDQVGAEARAIR
jgi:hypothetical protein